MNDRFAEMLLHKYRQMQHNIDRLEAGLNRENTMLNHHAGRCEVLCLQRQHLAFIQAVMDNATNYEEALDFCRARLLEAEEAHRKAGVRDIAQRPGMHSNAWWDTLREIEYIAAFMQRIKNWDSQPVRESQTEATNLYELITRHDRHF